MLPVNEAFSLRNAAALVSCQCTSVPLSARLHHLATKAPGYVSLLQRIHRRPQNGVAANHQHGDDSLRLHVVEGGSSSCRQAGGVRAEAGGGGVCYHHGLTSFPGSGPHCLPQVTLSKIHPQNRSSHNPKSYCPRATHEQVFIYPKSHCQRLIHEQVFISPTVTLSETYSSTGLHLPPSHTVRDLFMNRSSSLHQSHCQRPIHQQVFISPPVTLSKTYS